MESIEYLSPDIACHTCQIGGAAMDFHCGSCTARTIDRMHCRELIAGVINTYARFNEGDPECMRRLYTALNDRFEPVKPLGMIMKKHESDQAKREMSFGVGVDNTPAPQPAFLRETVPVIPSEVYPKEQWAKVQDRFLIQS